MTPEILKEIDARHCATQIAREHDALNSEDLTIDSLGDIPTLTFALREAWAKIAEMRQIVEGARMATQCYIGPLFSAGWNAAIEELLKRVDAAMQREEKKG